MPNILRNPYDSPGDPKTGTLPKRRDPELHKLQCYVSHEDYFFLRRHFQVKALTERILSNLFKHFIDELRKIDSLNPIATCFYEQHPSIDILFELFARLHGNPVGEHTGAECPRVLERGASDVHQALCDTPVVSPDEKGDSGKRGRRPRSKKKDTKEG